MISKITYTPFFSVQNSYSTSAKNVHSSNYSKGLNFDTVSFTSQNDSVEKVVSNAFKKLARNRKGEQLGTFMAKSNMVNIFLQETKFGKEAKLTLSDGIFGSKSFINLDIKRTMGEPVNITSCDDQISSDDAEKLVFKYLRNIL